MALPLCDLGSNGMSQYATILRAIKDNPNKTAAQLATILGEEQTPIDAALLSLVADARITKSGSGPSATYASTSTQ